ncbi:MAG: DNA primase [Deltaproteobacteria bacterium]|nr:DNA primase [Deltaproteobacteria bacterium]
MDFSEAKEEVRKAADIVELIGQYVQLKKRGQNYVGLCPFHSERSASFTVNQNKQIYHCFGCGRGGDVFSFWMEYHNLSFPQSLEDLAERYNITLPQRRDVAAERRKAEIKEQLFRINELACTYFHEVLLKSPKGAPGRDYFSKRRLSQETITSFKLGYAVNRWDGLTKYMSSKDCSLERVAQAGLIIGKKDGTYYDRFRNRIMFPIFDINRHIIGFGGRVLDDTLPKYINTPETPIYHKGACLYGLDSAYQDIREKGLAILVEGYMDVLALRQYGISNVVATLGTALTVDQVRRLKGYTRDLVVLFDPDDAGRLAALKSFPLCLNEGVSARVLVLPEGQDPDSCIHTHGPDAFEKLLEGATPIFDFYLAQALIHMGKGVDGKIKVLNEALPIFTELEQGATRFLYVKQFSEATGIDEAIVWEELKRRKRDQGRRSRPSVATQLSPARDPKKYGTEIQFLNLLVHYPETIDRFRDQEWELIVSDPEIVNIIKPLMEQVQGGGDVERIEELLESEAAKQQLRVTMLAQSFYAEDMVESAVKEFGKKIAKLKISQSIGHAKAAGDIEMLNRLIRAKHDLD